MFALGWAAAGATLNISVGGWKDNCGRGERGEVDGNQAMSGVECPMPDLKCAPSQITKTSHPSHEDSETGVGWFTRIARIAIA